MYFFFIGLLLVAFQVTCHGAPERLFPVPQLPADNFQEEKRVEKRAVDEDACLKAHNDKRALHQNTPDLIWNATLAQNAQDWADHLAENLGNIQHENTEQGENLYWAGGQSHVITCADAVDVWYDEEVSLYDYNNPPQGVLEFNDGGYGHFTQVIWKGTTHVGAGLKKVVYSNGYTVTYVVARYSPRGNIIYQFGENVKPEK